MVARWFFAVVVACAACAPEETTYPPLSTVPDCDNHPHLCGLPLTDLGGGDHDNAFDIVFVGDGFFFEDDFAGVVDRLVYGVAEDGAGPVSFDVDLFHFWRVDLDSRSRDVANDDLRDTPLAARLRPGDSCGLPFIDVDAARSHLAVRTAQDPDADNLLQAGPLADDLDDGFVHVVNVVKNVVGRANADVDVRMSSLDGAETLRHELGHALFELADEYAEFDSCPVDAALGDAVATDGDLVTAANIQRSSHPAKWAGLHNDSLAGGSRLPCLHHATACLMEGTSSSWCPVCEAAIAERLDLQRCGNDDREPPRVAIDAPLDGPDFVLLPGGSRIAVRAVADDTRDSSRGRDLSIEWVRTHLGDDEVVATGALAVIDLVGVGVDDVIFARAKDAQGNVGVSRPLHLEGAFPFAVVVDGFGGSDTVGVLQVAVQTRAPGTRVHVATAVEDAEVTTLGTQAFLALRAPLHNDGDEGVVVTAVPTSADGRVRGPTESFVISRVEQSVPLTKNTLRLAVGGVAVDDTGVLLLAKTTRLQVLVAGCTGVDSAGLIVDDVVHKVVVTGADQPGCDGTLGRVVVDFDGSASKVEAFSIDVAGRVTRTAPVAVRTVDLTDCGLDPVLQASASPFDEARVDLIDSSDAGHVFFDLVDADVDGRFRFVRETPSGVAFFPIDLAAGARATRLGISGRILCPAVAALPVVARFDVDLAGLPRSDRTPPLIVAPLHRHGATGVALVADEGPLERVVAGRDDIDPEGASLFFVTADDGEVIDATDGAGLATRSVVAARLLSLPRVPSCR